MKKTKKTQTTSKLKLHTLIYDLPSSSYHSKGGSYSSSQLKDLLYDPEIFYKKYITCEIPRASSDAFDEGTLVHTGTLEPHKLKEDCAVFKGNIRRGAVWDAFKNQHQGKAIVTEKQYERAMKVIKVINNNEKAKKLIYNSKTEVSCFVKIIVTGEDRIYAPAINCFLTKEGWVEVELDKKVKEEISSEGCVTFILKARADGLGLEGSYILDVKTTSQNACNIHQVSDSMSHYRYDLSAALYVDIFNIALFKMARKPIENFYWIFGSKTTLNCGVYVSTPEILQEGRCQWAYAVKTLARRIRADWEVSKDVVPIYPKDPMTKWSRVFEFEAKAIRQEDSDLL